MGLTTDEILYSQVNIDTELENQVGTYDLYITV